jgi:HK97 family phage major capsid protein
VATKARTAAELQEEIAAKQKQLHDIFANKPDLDFTAEEAEDIKKRNDELTDLGTAYEQRKALEDVRDSAVKGNDRWNKPANIVGNGQPVQPNGEPKVKTMRQIFAESSELKAFRMGQAQSCLIDLSEARELKWVTDPEYKNTIALTDINNPATRLPNIVRSAQEETTVADMMLQGTTDNNSLSILTETTFTNAAAEVAEAAAKPESALDFTETTEPVRKIATWLKATDELLADVRGFESYVRERLAFMVRRREETQLLVGDGTAPNISGITDRSGIQTQAKGADPTPDAFYKAITKVRAVAFSEPTGIVMHPNDWQDIRLLRTADGIYIFGSPQDNDVERMWGLPVRVTTAMTENTGLVGAFRPHAQIFRRSGITVELATEHASDFTSNLVTILAEERLALAVYRPAAFATVTGI